MISAINIRGRALAVPSAADRAERNRYRSICKYHMREGNAVPCWGIWQYTRTLKPDNLRFARKRKQSPYPDVHPKIRKAWWEFKRTKGRCDIYTFQAWYLGRGPYPLQYL